MKLSDPFPLPENLPVPADDGAADHLAGMMVPPIALPSTSGEFVRLDDPKIPWIVVYCYPRTGRPGEPSLGGDANWNATAGARGCTPQSCAYRDHQKELADLGAIIYGLSTQATEYQCEARKRLHLPFHLLSDKAGDFYLGLRLPFFEVAGTRLLKRLTLIIHNGRIVHCFYPVFPPDQDATNVITWLSAQR